MADRESEAEAAARRDALVERLFLATVGTWDVLAVYIGDRLGLYRLLAERGPTTSGALAEAAGLSERYVREWPEQQATSAIPEVDDASAEIAARRYKLPLGHDEALVDDESLNCIAADGQAGGVAKPIDAVSMPFRPATEAGRGIRPDLHEGQARSTRLMFDQSLASEWLSGLPRGA